MSGVVKGIGSLLGFNQPAPPPASTIISAPAPVVFSPPPAPAPPAPPAPPLPPREVVSPPPAPAPEEPAPLADEESPAVREAARTAELAVLGRSGRRSLILSSQKSRRRGAYSGATLGGAS